MGTTPAHLPESIPMRTEKIPAPPSQKQKKPATPATKRKRPDVDELVARITPQNLHEPIDFGPPVGREAF